MGDAVHLGYQRYTESKALTATRGELLVLVYDTCLKSLRAARQSMTGNVDVPAAHAAIVKAQRALEELQLSLDMSYGELSHNLYGLYEFMIHELVLANLHKDVVRVDNVLHLATELADAWRIAARTTATNPVAAKLASE
jgi:flagellar secretion chaperone FliS